MRRAESRGSRKWIPLALDLVDRRKSSHLAECCNGYLMGATFQMKPSILQNDYAKPQ